MWRPQHLFDPEARYSCLPEEFAHNSELLIDSRKVDLGADLKNKNNLTPRFAHDSQFLIDSGKVYLRAKRKNKNNLIDSGKDYLGVAS